MPRAQDELIHPEEESVRFTVPGEPRGKGRPRFTGKGSRPITPKDTASYENLVVVEYQNQVGNFRFSDGDMLDMRIKAFYTMPKSVSKKKQIGMLEHYIRPTKKPDMDNVVKVIADSLNHVAYRDDTQIVDCQVRKFYSLNPRVEIEIRRIGGR